MKALGDGGGVDQVSGADAAHQVSVDLAHPQPRRGAILGILLLLLLLLLLFSVLESQQ